MVNYSITIICDALFSIGFYKVVPKVATEHNRQN